MAGDFTLHPDLQALLDDHLGFVQRLHASNSLAPLAATMDLAGGITGAALVADPEKLAADPGTPDDTIRLLTERFVAAAQRGEIKASAIFYHGSNDRRSAPLPAEYEADANCVVAFLDHRDGPAFAAIINYLQDSGGTWRYAAPVFIAKKPLIFGGG
ncbi:hypothetical protein [Opitutus sp. GAS368]|jgi:hypothetical protein|uniref:hypothetical protein n=1 Tax=Opitutus sp. GAS368 TaxID=1882749 RepID=UPI00087B1FDA|nr:hypothetical protein [Opitutus sp. GAS368]SDR67312.1 hypothetical protein SAMN05444173_0293 [Opitutus sp. GAS368]